MSGNASYSPALGDYVVVPNCALLPGVGKIIAFEGTRPIVQSLAFPNITVTVRTAKRVTPDRCKDPEHPDCLVSVELAIDCAQWTRNRLSTSRSSWDATSS